VRYPPLAWSGVELTNSQLRRSERKSEGSGGSKKISSMRDEFENGFIGRIYDLGQSYSAFKILVRLLGDTLQIRLPA
jgi:hypothetical protein